MSPRQLPQNTACGGGVLVTLITPSSGRLAQRSSNLTVVRKISAESGRCREIKNSRLPQSIKSFKNVL